MQLELRGVLPTLGGIALTIQSAKHKKDNLGQPKQGQPKQGQPKQGRRRAKHKKDTWAQAKLIRQRVHSPAADAFMAEIDVSCLHFSMTCSGCKASVSSA